VRRHAEAGVGLTLLLILAAIGATPAVAAEPCPNEAIREQQDTQRLPDCRAYEMVSPVDKNGHDIYQINSNFGPFELAPGGDAAFYAAKGPFADAPAGPTPVQYIARRGAGGWLTESVTPPQRPSGSGQFLQVFGVSDDHERALVRSNAPLAPGAWPSEIEQFGEPLYVWQRGQGYRLLTPAPAPGGAGGPFGPTPYMANLLPASDDMSTVYFETMAELTDAAVPLEDFDPKVYRWDEGSLSLATVLPGGEAVAGSAATAVTELFTPFTLDRVGTAISRDGSRFFFTATAGPAAGDVFVREGGETRLIGDDATFAGATPNGDTAFILIGEEIEAVDVMTGTRTLISVDDDPSDGVGAKARGILATSLDGERIYFAAEGQLVVGAPAVGTSTIYLWDSGQIKYVAGNLGDHSPQPWTPTNSTFEQYFEVSPDGSSLLLFTTVALTGLDVVSPACTGRCEMAYLYSVEGSTATDPDVVCVSCPSGDDEPLLGPTLGYGSAASVTNLSADGDRAVFASPEHLVPADTNQSFDVYLWDGAQHLISGGRSGADSFLNQASADFRDILFTTREPLAGGDDDSAYDLYDARVGGGYPEPVLDTRPGCQADACQGPPAPLAALPAIGSSSFVGPASERPKRPKRCKGKGRAQGKAGARASRKGGCAGKRRANNHRGAGR
jgi:hypothetical protein